MGRELLGYRVRGTIEGKRVYLDVSEWEWHDGHPPLPYGNRDECVRVKDATRAEIEVSDVKIVVVYMKSRTKWPKLWEPGERILLLAAQGFRGVGRNESARNTEKAIEGCTTDEEAYDFLKTFKWNELADLPFPIRDVLGIDEHGHFYEPMKAP